MVKVSEGEVKLEGKMDIILTEITLAIYSWWEFAVNAVGEEWAYKCLKVIVKMITEVNLAHEVMLPIRKP